MGGVYDSAQGRFDHHQHTYDGPLSSAGMVLTWLEETGRISVELYDELRQQLVDYVDDVDNGRIAPVAGVPCFPMLIGSFNLSCESLEDFDRAFVRAGEAAQGVVQGIADGVARAALSREIVQAAMKVADLGGHNYMVLENYVKWKKAYFAMGGETHPTEFVLHPGLDGRWRVVAIPPEAGSFGKKCPLPEAWAGLRDDELADISGVEGAVFCHKNRFIAVWRTREQLERALRGVSLLR